MKIVVTSSLLSASSQNGQKGWYLFSTTNEWLKMPTFRMTDAFSLYCADAAWSDKPSDFFSDMYYEYHGLNSQTWETFEDYSLTEKGTQDLVIKPTGAYYTWNLPDDITQQYYYLTVDKMNFMMWGKARVKYPAMETSTNLYSRYEHVHPVILIQPSFSWDTSGTFGVSAGGISLDKTTYYAHNLTHYIP